MKKFLPPPPYPVKKLKINDGGPRLLENKLWFANDERVPTSGLSMVRGARGGRPGKSPFSRLIKWNLPNRRISAQNFCENPFFGCQLGNALLKKVARDADRSPPPLICVSSADRWSST